MSRNHSTNNISLTQREISAFTLCLAQHRPTENERRKFFASMPGRIDDWFATERAEQANLPVTKQAAYVQPES